MVSIVENTTFLLTIDLILSFVDDLLSNINIKQPLLSKTKEKWDSFSSFLRKKRPINLLHIQAFLQTKFHAEIIEENPQNLLKNDSFPNKTLEFPSMKIQEISSIHINLPYSQGTFKMKNTLDQGIPVKKSPSLDIQTKIPSSFSQNQKNFSLKNELNKPIKTEISLNNWNSSMKNTRTEPNENEKKLNEKNFFTHENGKKISFSDKKPIYLNSIQENEHQNHQINLKKININISPSLEKPQMASKIKKINKEKFEFSQNLREMVNQTKMIYEENAQKMHNIITLCYETQSPKEKRTIDAWDYYHQKGKINKQ